MEAHHRSIYCNFAFIRCVSRTSDNAKSFLITASLETELFSSFSSGLSLAREDAIPFEPSNKMIREHFSAKIHPYLFLLNSSIYLCFRLGANGMRKIRREIPLHLTRLVSSSTCQLNASLLQNEKSTHEQNSMNECSTSVSRKGQTMRDTIH